MNTIKLFLFNKFKILSILAAIVGFSLVLLIIRMKLTHSLFYLFLIWNLFLAAVPFIITSYLSCLPKLGKFWMTLWFCVWLLFLPNAPYIITDLLHLKISQTKYLWLDILVIISFALSGLFLFFWSIKEMKNLLLPIVKTSLINNGVTVIFFLSGFGIYLGRFLRYNSWEILSNPKHLMVDVADIATTPFANREAWLFTLIFGTFLYVGHWVFERLTNDED